MLSLGPCAYTQDGRRASPGDEAGFFEVGFELAEEGGVGDFFAVGADEAEGVDGGAFFGVDAGVGDGEAGLADGAEDLEEEADAVLLRPHRAIQALPAPRGK